jgi:hypothetical protein
MSAMNAKSLADYPLDGYLHPGNRGKPRSALQRDKFNLRPLVESIGWVLAGATVGSAAVMLGAWGLLQVMESRSPTPAAIAMTYQAPQPLTP